MDSPRASDDASRYPLEPISCPQETAAQTQENTTLLGDLYKRSTPPSLTSFLRNPFGQSPRSSSAFLSDIANKPPRNAWDREKRQGVNRKGKKRTVWKRYETRTNTVNHQDDKENVLVDEDEESRPIGSFNSPKKVLKKVCLAGQSAPVPKSMQRLAVAASYDRRRSGLPHKLRVLRTEDNVERTNQTNEQLGSMEHNGEEHFADNNKVADDGREEQEPVAPPNPSSATFLFEAAVPLQEQLDGVETAAINAKLEVLQENDSDMSAIASAEQAILTKDEDTLAQSAAASPTLDTSHGRPNTDHLEEKGNMTKEEDVHQESTVQPKSSIEESTLDRSTHSANHASQDEVATKAMVDTHNQIGSPIKADKQSKGTPENVIRNSSRKIVNDHNLQGPETVPADDEGDCMDFTTSMEDPTVVGDQYVGTLELRGLVLPSRLELTDEEASGQEDEGPDMHEDDPELFEFLDEKAARPMKSQQSPAQEHPVNNDLMTAARSPGEASPKIQPSEETTTVIVDFNDDENVLTDFISRAKASKAARIAKRTSDTHKRDSDVVKRALASPRKAVEDVETGSPADKPSTVEAVQQTPKQNTELSEDMEEQEDPCEPSEEKEITLAGRRSSRRTATPVQRENQAAPHAVSIRRPGAVVLRRTELQELANQTRTNTRRNKGAAIPAKAMLAKLRALAPEAAIDDSTYAIEQRRTVQWNVELVSFFDEQQKRGDFSKVSDEKASDLDANNTPKLRGRRGNAVDATNGTPAKAISASIDNLAEHVAVVENGSAKETEPGRKVTKRRQIPKPTSRTVTRTQSAALADQASSDVTDTNVADADGTATTASTARRNAVPRTRTSARR